MRIIGLTGGIGSGKSTIAAILAELGAIVIDADQVAREVVEPGKPALAEIVKYFGKEVVLPDGRLDRQALGALVFGDEDKREILNRITHPAIKAEIDTRLKHFRRVHPQGIVMIEASLLIEAGMTAMVDEIWLATVESEVQIERVMNRDGLDYRAALMRVKSQMSTEERLPYSNVVISTGQSFDEVRQQVIKHWERLQKTSDVIPSG